MGGGEMHRLGLLRVVSMLVIAGTGCKAIIGWEPAVLDDAGTGSDTCFDGVANGSETGVDCGGSCKPCEVGGGCKVGPDCVSGVCSGGTCIAPSCDDHVQNGDETGTDCGGSTCPKCGPGVECTNNSDCVSLLCENNKCTSSCTDGLKGGDETDVDCGGSCPPCPTTDECKKNSDCQSGVCENGKCIDYLVWAAGYGDSKKQLITGIAVDGNENVFATGSFQGGFDFGGPQLQSAGGDDVFLAKLDKDGVRLWERGFGDSTTQAGAGVAVDGEGNVVIAGFFAGSMTLGTVPLVSAGEADVFVGKFSAAGNHQWSRRFGDEGSQRAKAVNCDHDGNVIIVGDFDGTINFDKGPLVTKGFDDIFVAKFSPAGTLLWNVQIGADNAQNVTGVATSNVGDIALTGSFSGSVSFGGEQFDAQGVDAFVAVLDSEGGYRWSHRFGDSANQRGSSVAIDAAGDVAIAGDFQGVIDLGCKTLESAGDYDVFVARFDAQGNCQWAKQFGGLDADGSARLSVDSSGALVLTGTFNGTIDAGGGPLNSAGNSDIFVVKLDSSGEHIWSRSFGDTQNQSSAAAAAWGTQDVFLAGNYDGGINFGKTAITSMGGGDFFLARLHLPQQ